MPTFITTSLACFVTAIVLLVPTLAVADGAFKTHLAATSYARWHRLVKDPYSFLTTVALLALMAVGAYWIGLNVSQQIVHEARVCASGPCAPPT
ncbi:MAG: hypothetical protein JWO85_2647 [Candidatus Eremiobacteraeota bacterium]|nr:hypothetical protein [Candidatus Eremiobacteraeota bacterium]